MALIASLGTCITDAWLVAIPFLSLFAGVQPIAVFVHTRKGLEDEVIVIFTYTWLGSGENVWDHLSWSRRRSWCQ